MSRQSAAPPVKSLISCLGGGNRPHAVLSRFAFKSSIVAVEVSAEQPDVDLGQRDRRAERNLCLLPG